ncbi:MAG: hypothetical protein ACE5FO_06980 [Parvularculaceae bacterium]
MIMLAACETTPGPADAAALTNIHRVGVISAAGDKLFHHYVGLTVFGNKSNSFDILDWRLDDTWEEKITSALESVGSFESVNTDVDRALLYASYPPEDSWSRQWRIIDFKRAKPELIRVAQENDLDAIIVLSSDGQDGGRVNVILEGVPYSATSFRSPKQTLITGS